MILEATHTHLYPGHRGRLTGTRGGALPTEGGECLIVFTDGASTPGRLVPGPGDWRLDADSYRTAAGTAVPAKSWRLSLSEGPGVVAFRIIDRSVG